MVKLCDRETLLKEREQQLLLAERKKAEDLKRKQELERTKVINSVLNCSFFFNFYFNSRKKKKQKKQYHLMKCF